MCLNLTASGVIDGCGADASTMRASGFTPPLSAATAAAAWEDGHRTMLRNLSFGGLMGGGVVQLTVLGESGDELGDHVSGGLEDVLVK